MVDYPKDWEKTQLINILSIKKGKQKNSNEISSWAKYPHINGGIEESGYTFEWNTHPDTITISEGGNSCGFVNFQKRKFWAGGHCYVVLPDNRFVDTEFLYYLLKSHQNNLMSLRVGSGLPNIQSKSLLEYEVNLTHNKMEQKAIAETLMTFDRHIENLERLIEKKKMVRDGSVEDLMTGNTRPDGFDGEWKRIKLKDFTEINPNSSKPNEFYYIDLESVQGKSILNKKRFNSNQAPSRAQRVAKRGDVFFQTVRPYQRNNVLFNLEKNDYVFSSGYAQFRTSNSQKFLFQLIFKDDFVESVLDRCTGTSYPSISPKELGEIIINIPSDKKEQEAIASILTSMDEEIENLEKEKAKIEKIKAGAMDDLLTGRVRLI